MMALNSDVNKRLIKSLFRHREVINMYLSRVNTSNELADEHKHLVSTSFNEESNEIYVLIDLLEKGNKKDVNSN